MNTFFTSWRIILLPLISLKMHMDANNMANVVKVQSPNNLLLPSSQYFSVWDVISLSTCYAVHYLASLNMSVTFILLLLLIQSLKMIVMYFTMMFAKPNEIHSFMFIIVKNANMLLTYVKSEVLILVTNSFSIYMYDFLHQFLCFLIFLTSSLIFFFNH